MVSARVPALTFLKDGLWHGCLSYINIPPELVLARVFHQSHRKQTRSGSYLPGCGMYLHGRLCLDAFSLPSWVLETWFLFRFVSSDSHNGEDGTALLFGSLVALCSSCRWHSETHVSTVLFVDLWTFHRCTLGLAARNL